MSSTDVIDKVTRPLAAGERGPDAVRAMCRLVSVSVLATFLRDYPLTYLSKEERRVFLGFQKYVISLESREFEEAGIE